MEYQFALKVQELPLGSMKMVKINGTEILISNVNGTYYAISNTCTHLRGSLVNGTLEGELVTCPNHGAKFNVTNGKCSGPAKILGFKMTPKDIKTYQVEIQGENIMVQM